MRNEDVEKGLLVAVKSDNEKKTRRQKKEDEQNDDDVDEEGMSHEDENSRSSCANAGGLGRQKWRKQGADKSKSKNSKERG